MNIQDLYDNIQDAYHKLNDMDIDLYDIEVEFKVFDESEGCYVFGDNLESISFDVLNSDKVVLQIS